VDHHEWPLSRSFGCINETSLFRMARWSEIELISIIRRFLVPYVARNGSLSLIPRARGNPTPLPTPTASQIGRTCAPLHAGSIGFVPRAPLRYSARLNSMGDFLSFNRVLQDAPYKYRNISRRNAPGAKV
jgi:hypothetical protein